MSLTKPIPKAVRERLSNDPFMKSCCLADDGGCHGRIQWHHHFRWQGKRSDEPWGILPVCELHHRLEAKYKSELDRIMVSRATYAQLEPYCKAINYCALKQNHENND